VQVYFGSFSLVIEHIRAGKLRALAVTTPARFEPLPDIHAGCGADRITCSSAVRLARRPVGLGIWLLPPPALSERRHRGPLVAVRRRAILMMPKGERPHGAACTFMMRPTTAPSASTSKSSSFHSPDGREADARLRTSCVMGAPRGYLAMLRLLSSWLAWFAEYKAFITIRLAVLRHEQSKMAGAPRAPRSGGSFGKAQDAGPAIVGGPRVETITPFPGSRVRHHKCLLPHLAYQPATQMPRQIGVRGVCLQTGGWRWPLVRSVQMQARAVGAGRGLANGSQAGPDSYR
jgi:hypothetical protein